MVTLPRGPGASSAPGRVRGGSSAKAPVRGPAAYAESWAKSRVLPSEERVNP